MKGRRLDLSGTHQPDVKKHTLNPWLSEQGCIGQITGAYLGPMEEVLDPDQLPDAPRHPWRCVDERPCCLIEDVGAILPRSPGNAKRDHDD